MAKKPRINEKEVEAFHKAVEGTKPLKQKNSRILNKQHVTKPTKRLPTKDLFTPDESLTLRPVTGEEFIAYKQPSLSDKILRNLRKGQYNVDAVLDLHGMTAEKALIAVNDCLYQSLENHLRVLLIIHGKGQHSEIPILKNKLNHWLRHIDTVLAFCSAAEGHGNRGAIYVLLKSTSEESKVWTKKTQL